jgi:hypothetical protein
MCDGKRKNSDASPDNDPPYGHCRRAGVIVNPTHHPAGVTGRFDISWMSKPARRAIQLLAEKNEIGQTPLITQVCMPSNSASIFAHTSPGALRVIAGRERSRLVPNWLIPLQKP